MAPIKAEVNINREPMIGAMMHGKKFDGHDYLMAGRTVMFNQIVWCGEAL